MEQGVLAGGIVPAGAVGTAGVLSDKERSERVGRIVSRLREATEAADPAVMHFDLVMLQDLALTFVVRAQRRRPCSFRARCCFFYVARNVCNLH